MEGVAYTNPLFWVTLAIGGAVLASVSAFFTYQQNKESPEQTPIKTKGIVRDVLLGGIFTAMAWNLVPETMNSLTTSVQGGVTATTNALTTSSVASNVANTVGGSFPDVDLQIGPASF